MKALPMLALLLLGSFVGSSHCQGHAPWSAGAGCGGNGSSGGEDGYRVSEELLEILRARHPYPRGISFNLQIAIGPDGVGWSPGKAVALEGLAKFGWHVAQVGVQVPDEEHIDLVFSQVHEHLEDVPDLDIASIEIRSLRPFAAPPSFSPSHFSQEEEQVGAHQRWLETLLTKAMRVPLFNIRTLHVFCSSQAPCWSRQYDMNLERLGFRQIAVWPRECDVMGPGFDVLLESICNPFFCELEEPTANGTLRLREHLVKAAETMKTAPFKLHRPGQAAEAADEIGNVVRTFFVDTNVKQAMLPPRPPPTHRKLIGKFPLAQKGCECWSGRLALRLLPVLVGYTSGDIRAWIQDLETSSAAPTDWVFALANAVVELETVAARGDASDQALRAEERRIFGFARQPVAPFWLTSRGSLSLGVLMRSGWPIFRSLANVQLRLRPLGHTAAADAAAPDSRMACKRPLAEEFRRHLWIALEDEQPFDLELANAFYTSTFVRPRDLGCVLAMASCLIAQAAALQCRSAVAWKPRMMEGVAMETAQELLESHFVEDPVGVLKGLFMSNWPLLWVLARMERDHESLRRHARAFPASQRTAFVPAGNNLWSLFPPKPKLVSYGGGERAMRGGHWAKTFAENLFGDDPRFAVIEDFACPDVIVFMGIRPFPNNGVGLYVQAESGQGYVPPFATGLIYLGPEGSLERAAEYGALYDVPFASTSFAFRSRASPLDLVRPPGERAANVRHDQGTLAYLAARCVSHREIHFSAFKEEFRDAAVALGACNGSVLEGRTTTAQTPGRTAEDFMDNSVELLRGFEFAMAYENTNHSGYITEKIVSAYLAGAVPIYWGTPDVMEIFRPETFVYAPAFSSPAALAQHVAMLRSTAKAEAMRQGPILQPGALERFFSWHRDVAGQLGEDIKSTALRLLEELADPNV